MSPPPFARTIREAVSLLTPSPDLAIDGLPQGDGRTVLLMPAWFRGDPHTARMRAALSALGYQAVGWELGANLGPTQQLMDGVTRRLISLSEAHGPVTLVGFSMGGLFARWLGRTMPDHVRAVITVGSPIRDPLTSFWLPVAPFVRAWRGIDVTGLLDQISEPLTVPVTVLFTPDDGLVNPDACYDAGAGPENNIAFRGGHTVMASNQQVLTLLAQRLATDAGRVSADRTSV